MPLRIRCPHCRYVLVVADESAGEIGFCEYCKRGFTIPIPARDAPDRNAGVADGKSCPRCKHAVAPGAATCQKCDTNLADGSRAPFLRRVRWNSPRTWAIVGGLSVGLIAMAVAANHFYRVYYLPSQRPAAPYEPIERTVQTGEADAESLFTARTLANRLDATSRLRRIGQDAGATLARRLTISLEQESRSAIAIQNQRAAVRILGELGSPAVFETLEQAQRAPALRVDSLMSRAMLGDSRVVADASAAWLAQLQRVLFAARLDELQSAQRDAVRSDWAIAEWETLQRYSDALRKLGPAAVEAVAASYWNSWVWLGQARGEGLCSAMFELAKPARSDSALGAVAAQDENREDVRAARRMLDDIALRSSPATHAAVILTLAQCTPQYKRLRERHIAALAETIGDCNAADQQLLAWSLAKLTGRQFAALAESGYPSEATPETIIAIIDWARGSATTTAPATFKRPTAYPQPPALTRRVISPAQQQRAALGKRFHGSFNDAFEAAATWIDADLGCPPAMTAALSPDQKQPHYPALASAMIIVAHYGESSAIPHLQVWTVASDQPMWLRAMAALTRACFDARAGLAIDWPADIMVGSLPDDGPGWPMLGAIVAAGGERLISRVANASEFSEQARERLIEAARRELARRAQHRGEFDGNRARP
ncbi:MAG: zinc ribbon domain-containing protein [Phycisphaerales bacterium]|nr:zinc ribbon domain-containing protein [Phycisphaerales bacterium]